MRDNLQTLLLHQQLTEETQIFLQALRANDFTHAKHMMSEVWRKMSLPDFQAMIQKELPAFAKSTATFVGLIMDDGHEAVVDSFLYFSNEKWAACDVTFARNRDGWKVNRLSLREIDWAIEPFSPTEPSLSSRSESMEIEG